MVSTCWLICSSETACTFRHPNGVTLWASYPYSFFLQHLSCLKNWSSLSMGIFQSMWSSNRIFYIGFGCWKVCPGYCHILVGLLAGLKDYVPPSSYVCSSILPWVIHFMSPTLSTCRVIAYYLMPFFWGFPTLSTTAYSISWPLHFSTRCCLDTTLAVVTAAINNSRTLMCCRTSAYSFWRCF